MIYITGDLHGDITRFKSKPMKKLEKNDTLIICGDFGFIWDGSKKEERLLKWIGKRNYNVLFVEGTHDNLDLLSQYPKTSWNGGEVRQISGNLRHLCRGSVFTIEDNKIFAFGGGESNDISHRLESKKWWKEELPTQEEIETARLNLAKNDNIVDYIVTHQCSRQMKKLITMEENEANVLDTFFDEVKESCKYKCWFFGSYHKNKRIPPSQTLIFDNVMPINADRKRI